ncbi:hypothetical protein BU16DRAFT_535697 [Lophium mytilinum]|uniref:Uncharacterized protein n=1 Tax=Lophium mytilinum TaxID=390894 RepID=A0A6A6R5Z4_9PEZI|nr:hypothetical protein BU16DRAFT_535697 [Lophium mytilinum]
MQTWMGRLAASRWPWAAAGTTPTIGPRYVMGPSSQPAQPIRPDTSPTALRLPPAKGVILRLNEDLFPHAPPTGSRRLAHMALSRNGPTTGSPGATACPGQAPPHRRRSREAFVVLHAAQQRNGNITVGLSSASRSSHPRVARRRSSQASILRQAAPCWKCPPS